MPGKISEARCSAAARLHYLRLRDGGHAAEVGGVLAEWEFSEFATTGAEYIPGISLSSRG